MRLKTALAAIALLGAGFATTAGAQCSFFSSRSAWEAAATGLTNITFEENGSGGFTFHGTSATFSGVTFTTTDPFLFTVDPDFFPPFYDQGSGDVLSAQVGPPNSITASLPGAFTAVGTDLRTFGPDGEPVTLTLSNGDTFTLSSTGVPSFMGVICTTGITSATLSNGTAEGLNLDNFAFGAGTAVPEPGVLGLLAGVLVSGAAFRFRRRK